ncbi:hypothetical protein ASE07_05165 [Noviherbaspirillum sp. Root189]|nr:hypothetical protein ASE07_05165 [Noviherbaspirillum sp. Root189]
MIAVHVLPADTLFRLYLQDGNQTRALLWFRCSNNGDLVTRPRSSGRRVSEVKGNFEKGYFKGTSIPEPMSLKGNDEKDHVHLTFHPSVKGPRPVLFGVRRRQSIPRFDLCSLERLEEVVIHSLASPGHYPIESPSLDRLDGKYHGVITNPYAPGVQPKITFWVAPIKRDIVEFGDEVLVPGCFLYARCSPRSLQHDLLVQVKLDTAPYTEYGDVHIMAAPISGDGQT